MITAGFHSLSLITEVPYLVETSPEGKRAIPPPFCKYSTALLRPEKLPASSGLSVNGFTEKKKSLIFGIRESRKFDMVLISGRIELKMCRSKIPSIPP